MFLRKYKTITFLAGLSTILLLSACGASKSGDIDLLLTQKPSQPDTIPITISVKYAVYLDTFEKAVEEKFPQLDLIQVGNYTANYSDEYAEQLANDDLTDIVLTWPLDSAALHCEDKLLDLSGMEFTSEYNISMLNSIAQDGKLYYLPGPTQLRGILCNKSMFDENDWKIPTNYEEFIAVCKEIEDSGMRSLQLSFWNKEVLRNIFMGFGFGESFSSPQSLAALQNYNAGVGSLGDFVGSSFDSFERLIKEGILKPEDLDIRYPIREQMFFNRECAMISDGISAISLARKAGNTDDFVIIPFFSPGKNGAWGQITPTQYIGLNQHLTDSKNKDKYELALQIMEYISTPEGQLALADGNTSMVSSLSQRSIPDAPELIPMREIIRDSRYSVFPSLYRSDDALYDALAAMLRGEIIRQQAIAQVDQNNMNPKTAVQSPVIGTASATFSIADVGSYVTDTLRQSAGTDISLFLDNGKDGLYNAKGISSKLYQGNILETDITKRVFPVLQHDETGYLHIVTMTGENLKKTLEYSINNGNWFYYFSGLKVSMDPTATPGSRIQTITDENGNSIDPSKSYSIAILEGSVDYSLTEACETTEIYVTDILIDAIKEAGTITPSNDKRFQIVTLPK